MTPHPEDPVTTPDTPAPRALTDADLAKLRAYAEPWADTDVDSHIADLTLRLLAEHQALRESLRAAEAQRAYWKTQSESYGTTLGGVRARLDAAESALRQAQADLDAASPCDVCRGIGGQHKMSCYEHNRRDMRSRLRRERDEALEQVRQAQAERDLAAKKAVAFDEVRQRSQEALAAALDDDPTRSVESLAGDVRGLRQKLEKAQAERDAYAALGGSHTALLVRLEQAREREARLVAAARTLSFADNDEEPEAILDLLSIIAEVAPTPTTDAEPRADRRMMCSRVSISCGVVPHRWAPSPDAGPYWRCSECGSPTPDKLAPTEAAARALVALTTTDTEEADRG